MGATRIIQLSLVMAILVPVLLRWGRRRFSSESPRFLVDLGGGVPAVGTFLFCEVYGLDVSWNVSIGRDILATLSVPAVDRHTVAGPGHSDQDIHGLFQVLAVLARSFAGWAGVELLQAALGSVALLFAWRAARWWAAPEAEAFLALAQLTWANSHGLFVLGPFLAGCALLDEAGEKLRGGPASLAPEARLLALSPGDPDIRASYERVERVRQPAR